MVYELMVGTSFKAQGVNVTGVGRASLADQELAIRTCSVKTDTVRTPVRKNRGIKQSIKRREKMLLYVMSSSEMEGTYHKSLIYVSSGLWQIGAIGKLVPSAKVWYWCVVRLLPSSAKPTSLIAGAVTWAQISRIPNDFIPT